MGSSNAAVCSPFWVALKVSGQDESRVSDGMLFPAPAEKRSGAGLIIAPGGAYQFLSWAHEGEQVARWFNGVGVTAFILKYRVPTG